MCYYYFFLLLESIAHSSATFGQGTAPILMDDVQCVGTEPQLVNCTFDPDASEDYHFEDAGVTCFGKLLCNMVVVYVLHVNFNRLLCTCN